MDFVIVTTTVETEADAQSLAKLIVDASLAACVQSSPIRSTYRWKGKVEVADEHLLHAKTRKSLANDLCAFIKSNHSYEEPEIVITPILGGSQSYLDWIMKETEQ